MVQTQEQAYKGYVAARGCDMFLQFKCPPVSVMIAFQALLLAVMEF